MKKVLVTGAAGFIGSHVVRELLADSTEVRCLIRPGENTANLNGLDVDMVTGDVLDAAAIAAREPHLSGEFSGAIHFPDPGFVPDPGGLTKAYAALFGRKGGRYLAGDARTLEQSGARWRLATQEGAITAREVVVAMGPWSDQIFAPLGYSIPLAVKVGPYFSSPGHMAKRIAEGKPPDLIDPPSGCRFYPRCPDRHDGCDRDTPPLRQVRPGHFAACDGE